MFYVCTKNGNINDARTVCEDSKKNKKLYSCVAKLRKHKSIKKLPQRDKFEIIINETNMFIKKFTKLAEPIKELI